MRSPSSATLPRRDALALLAAGSAALVATGCQGLLPGGGPPPLLFVLSPKSSFRPDLPTVGWQLLVEIPVAPASIDTPRIALQQTPFEVDYYARARWPDRAPLMVQTLIVESFENSRRIGAVGRLSADLRADFVLKTDLREFQVEYFHGPQPRARVALLARLVAMPGRSIIGFRRLEVTEEATDNRLFEVVRAFDEALGKVLRSLVEWTLSTGEARQGPSAPGS